MEEESGFIFYENNYLWSSFSAFQDMRIKEEHTDLTIKTKNQSFSVHRVVLAARIPHFRKILTSTDREILLSDMDSGVLHSLINFAYEGKLKVTLENSQSILFAAVCLQLYEVQKACLEFQAKRFNANSKINIIYLIPSDTIIRNNFEEFCTSQEFLLLPYYSLKELIGRDDLKVKNEEKVFEAVIKWIKASLAERQHHLPYLLPEIRMNFLSPEYLIETVGAETVITTSPRAKQIVEDVKSYLLLKKRPLFLSFNTNTRLYTQTKDRTSCDPISIIATNQTGLMPSDRNKVPLSNIPSTNQSDLRTSDTCNFLSSNNHATDESDMTASDFSASNVPSTDQNDLAPSNANDIPPSNILSTNQSDLIPMDANNIPSNNIATNQSDVVPGNASNVSPSSNLATNQNDSMPIEASNVSPSKIATTNQSNVMSSGANNVPCNESTSSLCNRSDYNSLKHGIYAVRSFSSGTFVSYYNYKRRKWDDFSFISHCDLVLHVVSMGEKLYVFFPQSVETFHLVTHEWNPVEQLSISTEGSGIVSQGNKIYIFGGTHDPDRVQCFDTQENKWLQNESMRVPCHSMSVVSTPEKFVLHTGGSSTSCINAFSIFHTSTKKWTVMPSMITCRMNHNSAVSCGQFYVCGGGNDEIQFLDTVEVYDTASRHWNLVSHSKVSRISHSLAPWRKKLYVFGGKTEHDACSCLVEIYDPETDKWTSVLPVQPLERSPVTGVPKRLDSAEAFPINVKATVVAAK